MLSTPWSRWLTAAAAVTFIAGCAGNSGSITPNQPSSVSQASHQASPGMRWLPGPAVLGPIQVPVVPHRMSGPHGWPPKKKKTEILFVADLSNSDVELYNPKTPNPTPEGSITTGISNPAQVAVDKKGTLYVANIGNSTITEYPKGSSTPSVTLTSGLSGPYGVAVDSKGDVFASNLDNNTVVGYMAGASTPYETIAFSALGQPVGIATDGNDNLWVACDTDSIVYEIPAGSSTPQNAGLSGLAGTIGIAFGPKDIMYISNISSPNVQVYAYGTTSPMTTITDGISSPTLNGFTANGSFFQSNQDLNVVGFKKGQTTFFSTITGLSDPLGIASSPLVKK